MSCEAPRSTFLPRIASIKITVAVPYAASLLILVAIGPVLAPQEVSIKRIKTGSIMTSLGMMAGFDCEEEELDEESPKSHPTIVSR